MASVTVRTAATKAPTRQRVVLRSAHRTVTLPITSPVTPIGLGGTWTSIARPGLDQLLRYEASKPYVVTLDVMLISLHGVSPSKVIGDLDAMSRSNDPVSVSYGVSETGTYRITDLRPKITRRAGSQNASEAELTIELTRIGNEKLTVPSRVTPAKPSSASSSGKASTGTKAGGKKKVVHYTVKRGDTLIRIATKVCHNSAHWQRIAKDNKIRDPRKLVVGKRLTITCL